MRSIRRPAVAVCALVAAVLVVSGCTLPGRGGEPTVTTGQTTAPATQTPNTSETATSSAQATGGAPGEYVQLSELKLSLSKVADGFSSPLYVTNAADGSGRLFVVEQTGKVRVVRGRTIAPGAFLDVTSLVSTGGERGLLGLAFAPDYKTSGRFYVDYTDARGNTVVARYVASPPSSDTPKLAGPTRLLYIQQPYSNHNGGCIQFGPDGMLYVGMGDGGSAGDPENRAQNLASPLGKMLRIDVSGAKYSAPKDNPYPTAVYPKNIIWAKGLRNPWRFSFDPETKDLWIGDVGQGRWEEIDLAPASAADLNYGWRKWEGTHPYPPDSTATTRKGFTFPVVEYPHPTGESVTGGYVYRGKDFPALAGTYLYADYVKGWIGAARRQYGRGFGKMVVTDTARLLNTDLSISSFGVDENQELYLTDLRGGLYRVQGRAK